MMIDHITPKFLEFNFKKPLNIPQKLPVDIFMTLFVAVAHYKAHYKAPGPVFL